MPVLFDSSASGNVLVLGGATSASKTLTHNVSPAARDRMIAFVAVLFTGEVDTDAATFTATFGGVAMTQIGSLKWDSDKGTLRLFKLEDVARGSQSVVVGFTGMGTELVTRSFMVVSLTYSGVDEVGSIVDEGASSTTSNTVAVDSVRAAHRVVSVHAVGKLHTITAYNQTRRGSVTMFGGGQLVAGDAPGDETVTCTATHNSATDEWGAIGLAMTPAVVEVSARMSLSHALRSSVATFRVATPHPDREWMVEPPTLGELFEVRENFIGNPGGVWMPVWRKDTNDTLEYTLHWDHFLADDDEIVGVQHTTSGSLRWFSQFPTDGDESHTILGRSSTQVWLNGGTAGITHPVRVRFTTRRGRQHDFTFFIACVEN